MADIPSVKYLDTHADGIVKVPRAESESKPATWIFISRPSPVSGGLREPPSRRPECRRLQLAPTSCERLMIVSRM